MSVAEFAETGLPQDVIVGHVPRKRSHTRRWAFLGMLPFVAFITIFLLIPTGEIIVGAFRTVNGAFTLSNISDIFQAPYPAAFQFSVELSALSALIGGIFGFLLANAILHHGVPRWIRPAYISFSGMAANFAGVPLAFAYGATLGSLGVVTVLLKHLGLNIYPTFSLQGLFGAALVYRVLSVPPHDPAHGPSDRRAAHGVAGVSVQPRSERFHVLAAHRLADHHPVAPRADGAAVRQCPLRVRRPAEALGISNLVTIDIAELVDGNMTLDPQAAYALALGMIVIIIITITIYSLLQRRTSRWLR